VAAEQQARHAAQELIAAKPDFTIASWEKTQQNRSDAAQVQTEAAALGAAGLN
jgi:hypothetical protein